MEASNANPNMPLVGMVDMSFSYVELQWYVRQWEMDLSWMCFEKWERVQNNYTLNGWFCTVGLEWPSLTTSQMVQKFKNSDFSQNKLIKMDNYSNLILLSSGLSWQVDLKVQSWQNNHVILGPNRNTTSKAI